jgi:hypothetical protein
MAVNLDTLELRPEARRAAEEAIRHMAHRRWDEAGQPAEDDLRFWLEAEREWIERCYVPDRGADGPA